MAETEQEAIFIFRRDLRLIDNIGLYTALQNSSKVWPIFILNPLQLEDKKNNYKSDMCVQYMIESLIELHNELVAHGSKLWLFHGTPEIVINKLLDKHASIKAVYYNMDYTPYARARDEKINEICKKHDVSVMVSEDALLNPVASIKTGNGNVYQKFTPYFNVAKKIEVARPLSESKLHYNKLAKATTSNNLTDSHAIDIMDKYNKNNPEIWLHGGRTITTQRLRENISKYKNYNTTRDNLTKDTTYLSAANKFGVISIREVYWIFKDKLGNTNDLIKQLYWRDFYYNLIWAFPQVIGSALKPQYNKIYWKGSADQFEKWKQGQTGFPIIDAAMRSLNATGYMHNRGRLIVSNFLIKILLIDWREGEQYFAQKLYDYDPALNNGNWQWSAGTGADSQPYFRIFNPWLQSKKHDSNALYIKKWLPELANVEPKHLHAWDKYYSLYEPENINHYPKPMVDYEKQRKLALDMYKKVL